MMIRVFQDTLRFGFTLIELMVAVVVLLVVMIAVGRIFSTTSAMTATGSAISETMQQGLAIEKQLREDILKVSREGFFAIRSVAIANNKNSEYYLLDDSLPPEAIIRCDQLVFFTDGLSSPKSFTANPFFNSGTIFSGRGLASMVYYGHGIQLPQLEGMGEGANDFDVSDDPKYFGSPNPIVTPWYEDIVMVESRKYTHSSAERFDLVTSSEYETNGTQGSSNTWMLCRQAIVLGDDDMQNANEDGKKTYMGTGVSSHTIFPWDPRISAFGDDNPYPHVLNGRVDIAATQLDDIRQSVLQSVEGGGDFDGNRYWRNFDPNEVDQQELIASLFHWPRVEPYPITTDRYDQALMLHALAKGCSSFKIEWTYDEGVGETYDGANNWFPGYKYDDLSPQPWWGHAWRTDPDDLDNLSIEFDTLANWTILNDDPLIADGAYTIAPELIEASFDPSDGTPIGITPTVHAPNAGIAEYWAIFGYNRTKPFEEDQLDLLNDDSQDNGTFDQGDVWDNAPFGDEGLDVGDETWRYTPWPSALRITLRIMDEGNRLGSGWTYQFIVDLPEVNE